MAGLILQVHESVGFQVSPVYLLMVLETVCDYNGLMMFVLFTPIWFDVV